MRTALRFQRGLQISFGRIKRIRSTKCAVIGKEAINHSTIDNEFSAYFQRSVGNREPLMINGLCSMKDGCDKRILISPLAFDDSNTH